MPGARTLFVENQITIWVEVLILLLSTGLNQDRLGAGFRHNGKFHALLFFKGRNMTIADIIKNMNNFDSLNRVMNHDY